MGLKWLSWRCCYILPKSRNQLLLMLATRPSEKIKSINPFKIYQSHQIELVINNITWICIWIFDKQVLERWFFLCIHSFWLKVFLSFVFEISFWFIDLMSGAYLTFLAWPIFVFLCMLKRNRAAIKYFAKNW